MGSFPLQPPPGFSVPPPFAAPKDFAYYGKPFSPAVMKPFCGGGGDVDYHNLSAPSMMQSGAHGEGRFGVKKYPQRPAFNSFSTGYLDYVAQSLWNGSINSALNVSTASSDGWSSGSESAVVGRPRPTTPLFGGNMSFFGDFGFNKLAITPIGSPTRVGNPNHIGNPTPTGNCTPEANNSSENFHQKKSASERKASQKKGLKCSYCRGPHRVKDKQGKTLCPELRALKCPVCNNTNPEMAHTVRFCPNIRMKRAIELQQELDAATQKSSPVLPNTAGL